jgi:hypothetical protein
MPDPNSNKEKVVKFPPIPGAEPRTDSESTPPSSNPTFHPSPPPSSGKTNSPKDQKILDELLEKESCKFFERDALNLEGFPPKMMISFAETATNLDCVVTSRTPEGPAGGLIDEGHDLKGYEIKSKSCTWGPMAGFLCKLPPLNKYGSGKIKYNYGYLRSFYTKWTPERKTFDDLFQPIQISNERKIELFANKNNIFDLGNKGEAYIELGNNAIYGICSSGEKAKGEDKIRMEYYLEKDTKLDIWSIYHGVIFYLKEKKEIHYTGNEGEKFFIKDTDKNKLIIDKIVKPALGSKIILAEETDKKKITEIRNLNKFQTATFIFNKIEGAKNIYPPYAKSDILYKNCVTGDYDLFACWPTLEYPLQELIRISEYKLDEENSSIAPKTKHFLGYGKPLTLSMGPISIFDNIYIEFIPGIPIIEKLEIDNKGNINELTEKVASMLNSCAGMRLKIDNTYPNRAFHNDEGGRPLIDDIEFPVAYFIPDKFFNLIQNKTEPFYSKFKKFKGGCLKDVGEFLDLIMICRENGYRVSLNYGWIIYLITIALNEEMRDQIIKRGNDDLKKKMADYLVKNPFIPGSTDKVLKYLFGYTFYKVDNQIIRYQATNNFLTKVAKVFLPFLDMNETDTSFIIEKVNAAKNIEVDASDFQQYQL